MADASIPFCGLSSPLCVYDPLPSCKPHSSISRYVWPQPNAGHRRVNRMFRDKEGGLVVDYVGIDAALKLAMNDYTVRGKQNYGDPDVSKAAYSKFIEKPDVCRDLFHGFDYATFMTGDNLEKAQIISDGVNFLLDKSAAEHDLPEKERTQSVYIKEALLIKQALSLCGTVRSAIIQWKGQITAHRSVCL